MGVMWEYFRDSLRWPLVRLKQGALAMLAEGGGNALDDVREAVLWLRKQFLPATAEDVYLANYGVSRGLVRHPLESDAHWKRRVVRAYAWHLLGGKQAGLPQILEFYGYTGGEILNWRQYDPERWAEFWCRLLPPADQAYAAEDYELLLWLLNEYKPARSKLVKLSVAVVESATPRIGILAATGDRHVLLPRFDPSPLPGTLHAGVGLIHGERQTVPVVDLVLPVARPPIYGAAIVVLADRITVRSA